MFTYDWSQFKQRILVDARLKEIYQAWTTSRLIEKWFVKKSGFVSPEGKPLANDEAVTANCNYSFEWFGYDLTETGKILETDGKSLLRFTFSGECTVTVKLTDVEEQTLVELKQENIPTDEETKVKYHLNCQTGWTFFLANLKSVFEGGVDLRNKDEKMKGVLNN
jgi:uncharacterized protein YndB with AHSA1/START domain